MNKTITIDEMASIWACNITMAYDDFGTVITLDGDNHSATLSHEVRK